MRRPAWIRVIERPPRWWRALCPGALFRGPGDERVVYLTFDDGPIPEVTPGVLDILDRFGARATFFMVGDNARRHPELVEEVRSRGHGVGNHTMHHLQGMHCTAGEYAADVAAADRLLHTRLFRPPHGWLKPSQTKLLSQRYKIVMYDLVSRDYNQKLTAGDILDNVVTLARPGSVIVFHDSLKSWPRLREALPRALAYLRSEGYDFGLL